MRSSRSGSAAGEIARPKPTAQFGLSKIWIRRLKSSRSSGGCDILKNSENPSTTVSRMSDPGEITRLLAEWNGGNRAALDSLVRIVYDELRRLASGYMRGERPDHMLQTTALVNEAYLRLIERHHVSCQTRTQFFAIAAQVMRRVLVDYARSRNRVKRGDGTAALSLDDVAVLSPDRAEELLAIHTALERLSAFDHRKGRVFELRYFGGLSVEEVAETLNVSDVTVARDWKMAKMWLRREIAPGSQHAT